MTIPTALNAGPTGAALVTGNTVVIKPASDTPWAVRLLVDALRDAGLPDGVFNYVTGPGSTLDHPQWDHEMFLPITMVHKVRTLDEAMLLANKVNYGLTAGFYGEPEEASWFFENIQAGVTYANRSGFTFGPMPIYLGV